MASEITQIDLGCKVHRELYNITWNIENFHLMPYLEEHHPVCGGCFLLGTTRETTWSLLMTKVPRHGVNNVGFKVVRRSEGLVWDMVTYSLSVKLEDGRMVKIVDKVVIGVEDDNPYVYLVRPSKTDSPNQDASTQVENGLKATTDFKCTTSKDVNLGSQKTCCITTTGEDVNLGTQKTCCITTCEDVKLGSQKTCSITTTCEDVKLGSQKTCCITTTCEDVKLGSQKTCNCAAMSSKDVLLKSCKCINCECVKEDEVKPKAADYTPKMAKFTRVDDSPKIDVTYLQQGPDAAITPEELSNLKDLTVVFSLEYTYMVPDCDSIFSEDSEDYGLKEDMRQLLFSSHLSDITFRNKGVNIPCHKILLMSRSDHFKKVLESEPGPTVDLDLEVNIAKALIEFMYTDGISEELLADEYRELCKVADRFKVHGMKKYCLEMLEYLDENDLEEGCPGKVTNPETVSDVSRIDLPK